MPIGLSKWKISGRQAASEIRKFNLAIPIIAITAYAAAGDRQNSMDAGMNDYVSKPIKQQALLAVLDKWFPLEYPDVKQEI